MLSLQNSDLSVGSWSVVVAFLLFFCFLPVFVIFMCCEFPQSCTSVSNLDVHVLMMDCHVTWIELMLDTLNTCDIECVMILTFVQFLLRLPAGSE